MDLKVDKMIINIYDKPLLSWMDLVYENDTITLISVVRINDDGDESEVHYSLSKDETKKILDKYTLVGFVEKLRTISGIKEILDFLKCEGVLVNSKGF